MASGRAARLTLYVDPGLGRCRCMRVLTTSTGNMNVCSAMPAVPQQIPPCTRSVPLTTHQGHPRIPRTTHTRHIHTRSHHHPYARPCTARRAWNAAHDDCAHEPARAHDAANLASRTWGVRVPKHGQRRRGRAGPCRKTSGATNDNVPARLPAKAYWNGDACGASVSYSSASYVSVITGGAAECTPRGFRAHGKTVVYVTGRKRQAQRRREPPHRVRVGASQRAKRYPRAPHCCTPPIWEGPLGRWWVGVVWCAGQAEAARDQMLGGLFRCAQAGTSGRRRARPTNLPGSQHLVSFGPEGGAHLVLPSPADA